MCPVKKLLVSSSFVFTFCHDSSAQEMPPISTDRPDQTESPFVTPAGYFQFEAGFNYEQVDEQLKNLVYPTLLSKFGINDRVEFRLITELNTLKSDSTSVSGLNPLTVGFKSNLVQQDGAIPQVSFIGHLSIPELASEDFKGRYYTPSFRFLVQHALSDRVSLGYNLGAEWDGETAEPVFLYTLATGLSLSDQFGAYVEVFGYAPQEHKAAHQADGGFTWLINPDTQMDLSGGVALSDNAPDYYASLGFSFRFSGRGKKS